MIMLLSAKNVKEYKLHGIRINFQLKRQKKQEEKVYCKTC